MLTSPFINFNAAAALVCLFCTAPLCAAVAESRAAGPRPSALMMYVTLDRVVNDPQHPVQRKIGDIDKIRLTFDASLVDPKTHRVQLTDFQHVVTTTVGAPAAEPMPVADSWLDLSRKPYRLHYRALVVHGTPIIIEVGENTRRLAVHPQSDPGAVIIAGPYRIDTRAIAVR